LQAADLAQRLARASDEAQPIAGRDLAAADRGEHLVDRCGYLQSRCDENLNPVEIGATPEGCGSLLRRDHSGPAKRRCPLDGYDAIVDACFPRE
jgi:hypothetical protein